MLFGLLIPAASTVKAFTRPNGSSYTTRIATHSYEQNSWKAAGHQHYQIEISWCFSKLSSNRQNSWIPNGILWKPITSHHEADTTIYHRSVYHQGQVHFPSAPKWKWKLLWLSWHRPSWYWQFTQKLIGLEAEEVQHEVLPAESWSSGGPAWVQCTAAAAGEIRGAWDLAEAFWTWYSISKRDSHMVVQEFERSWILTRGL